MKLPLWKLFIALIMAIIVLGLLPATVLAASPSAVVLGNNYTLGAGETLTDDLFVLGGSVILENGSTVNGNIFLLGGNLQAAGKVNGDITVLGGTLNLASTLILNGNLTTTGTSINRDPGAQITGQIRTGENAPYFILPGGLQVPNWSAPANYFLRVVGFFLRLFLWALVAMIVVMFIPDHLARTSQAALSQPLISGGMGILTIIVVPIILILLAITICLIPVSLIGILVLVIGWAFGLIALGLEVGKRISAMFKRDWHPAISAGLGTLGMMAVLSGLEAVIPCIGWIPKALAGLIGLGAVLLTQFGTKPYLPSSSTPAKGSENSLPA